MEFIKLEKFWDIRH